MANSVRGFCAVKIGEETHEVALNMGALAELETEFGVESFEDALDFGDKVSATRLRKFMRALLKGNGIEMTPQISREIDTWTPSEFMDVVSRVLVSSGLAKAKGDSEDAAPAPEGDAAPLEGASAGEHG